MPFLAPVIPAIVGAVVSGGIGLGVSELTSGGGGGNQDQTKLLQQQEQQQAQQDKLQQQKLIQANIANNQESTGGNVTPTNLVDLTAIVSGLPGAVNTSTTGNALASFLGTPPPQPDNLVSATYGINGGQG